MSETCWHCGELVLIGEEAAYPLQTEEGPRQRHRECAIRNIVGSVGHIRGTCSCKGGTEEDPPGMTKRQAAEAAVEEWKARLVRNAGGLADQAGRWS